MDRCQVSRLANRRWRRSGWIQNESGRVWVLTAWAGERTLLASALRIQALTSKGAHWYSAMNTTLLALALFLCLLVSLTPAPAAGQRASPSQWPPVLSEGAGIVFGSTLQPLVVGSADPAPDFNTSSMVATGLLWGAGGLLVGFLASGYLVDEVSSGVLNGVVLQSLLLPLGVHHANGWRGKYLPAAAASVGVAAAGVVLGERYLFTESGFPVLLSAITVTQLWASVTIERRTTP